MTEASEIKKRLDKRLDHMTGIRDRVRLRVRRASMAAKMRWDVMEAELYDHEKAAEAVVTEANHAALTASMVKVEAFRAWLDAAG